MAKPKAPKTKTKKPATKSKSPAKTKSATKATKSKSTTKSKSPAKTKSATKATKSKSTTKSKSASKAKSASKTKAASKVKKSPAKAKRKNEARVVVRPVTLEDLPAVQELHKRVFPGMSSWSLENVTQHIRLFPEGQLVVELDGALIATSSSMIVDDDSLGERHKFDDICPRGFLRGHDPEGDMLYGLDIAVDPAHRGHKIARRLYDARKELTKRLGLRGIVFGGRMPRYHLQAHKMSAAAYLKRVLKKELRDPVINAQRANGFVVRGVLPKYLPSDKESCGNAVFMIWNNPDWVPSEKSRRRSLRVAAVQYEMRPISSVAEFETQCEFFIDTASEYRVDILLFPELLTNQLLALVPAPTPAQSARKLSAFTDGYNEFFARMAIRYNVNIIAGTHLVVEDGVLYNVASLFHRDGRVDRQYKLHITPSEARWWGVTHGNDVEVFDTDCGRVAIAICYDVEFPELARIAKGKGAEVLFVPYNTDIRAGHLRVRTCAQARAVESHMYVVTAGVMGNLPQVEGADIHYAQSAILTPSDIPFARDGVAAEATPNVETMLVHDLDLILLRRTELTGTVRTWPDRRTDLYRVEYTPKDGKKQSF